MARIFASLLVLGSSAFVLTNCGSSDKEFGTPSAGSTGVAGSSAGTSATAGAPAAGAPAGGAGSTSVGGAGSAGMATAGSAGSVAGGGANAGASQGGSGGASAGAGGRATGGGSSGGAGGQSGGAFALTSSKLTASMAFPADFTCAGADHSPPFSWTAGPGTTLSYALVLQDTNNNLNHWVLYDIPAATTTLPESLETASPLATPAGAKQKAFSGMGYMGPCPSGMTHTYTFTLYALDTATLPGVTASSATNALVTAIQAHDVASATLSATSNATMM